MRFVSPRMRVASSPWLRLWRLAVPAAALTEHPLLWASAPPLTAVAPEALAAVATSGALALIGAQAWEPVAEAEKALHYMVRISDTTSTFLRKCTLFLLILMSNGCL